MTIIGISPLSKIVTACLVVDGQLVSAIGEAQLSRMQIHTGLAYEALEKLFCLHGLSADDNDVALNAFADRADERRLTHEALAVQEPVEERYSSGEVTERVRRRPARSKRVYASPGLDLWRNTQLGRTEFMPFAPATRLERRESCYSNTTVAEHATSFMIVAIDRTRRMKRESPAPVHVDGTARPQLVSKRSNPGFHLALKKHHRLTGMPSVINTSFDMPEEPIACDLENAIRAFSQGNHPCLAIESFTVSPKPAGSVGSAES